MSPFAAKNSSIFYGLVSKGESIMFWNKRLEAFKLKFEFLFKEIFIANLWENYSNIENAKKNLVFKIFWLSRILGWENCLLLFDVCLCIQEEGLFSFQDLNLLFPILQKKKKIKPKNWRRMSSKWSCIAKSAIFFSRWNVEQTLNHQSEVYTL